MKIVAGTARSLSARTYEQLGRYRYEVFVERLKWRLDAHTGLEFDEFDREDTVHVLAHDASGHLVGTARLLPSTRPYLLQTVFSQLLDGMPAPASPDVWELSRFAAWDLRATGTGGVSGQFSSRIAVQLLRETVSVARGLGARSLISVSPVGVERLLRAAGFQARRAGPPMQIDGHMLFANWIDCVDVGGGSDGTHDTHDTHGIAARVGVGRDTGVLIEA